MLKGEWDGCSCQLEQDEVVTGFKSVKLHHHWPCTVCGGHTSGVNVLNESEDGTVRVCEHCLKENAIDIARAASRSSSTGSAFTDRSPQGAYLRGVAGGSTTSVRHVWQKVKNHSEGACAAMVGQ